MMKSINLFYASIFLLLFVITVSIGSFAELNLQETIKVLFAATVSFIALTFYVVLDRLDKMEE